MWGRKKNKPYCSREAARMQKMQLMELPAASYLPTTSDSDELSDRPIEAEPPQPEFQSKPNPEQKRKKSPALQKLKEKVKSLKAEKKMKKQKSQLSTLIAKRKKKNQCPINKLRT